MDYKTSLPCILFIGSDVAKIAFFKKSFKKTYYVMNTHESFVALEWLKTTQIEVVIIDFKSFEEPLYNFCEHIRKTPGLEKLPILLVSNKIQKSFTTSCLNAGVTDFLHEPLDENELFERIAVCLKTKLVSKKMSLVSSKISASPLIPKNTQIFLHRMLLNNKSLKEISKAKKIDMPLSLLLIQLDGLSSFQKDLGELVVEEIIAAVEHLLASKLRQFDTLLHQGGGRFLLMLPKTSPSAAKIIAEDIRKEVCRTTIHTRKKELLTTVSIGVVSFDKKLNDVAEAYDQFDHSLQMVSKCLERAQKKGNKIISENNLNEDQ
ncbi:MAG: diguanylate cyclase [Chlamydiae bacterium]|nr:diguanylate cyclase [Chlamydiota bacterium]